MHAEAPGIERVVEGTSPPEMFAEHLARYRFAAERLSGARRVLDVACGTGYGSRFLHDAGVAEVTGVDRDPLAVAYARDRYGAPGITFKEGDALDPPIEGPVDAVVSFETIEHLDDPGSFTKKCREILRPGSLFIVSTPWRIRTKPDGSPRNPYHRQEWRDDEFRALLAHNFTTIDLFGQSLALRKRPFQPSRKLARGVARLRGFQLNDPDHIFPLPAPGFLGVWETYPVFILAVCRR